MDRTDEFISCISFFLPAYNHKNESLNNQTRFMSTACQVWSAMEGNEILLQRMQILTNMKEFSNDPTTSIQEISILFEQKLEKIKQDMEILKKELDSQQQNRRMLSQHRNIIVQKLSKTLSDHVNVFKSNLKVHGDNVEQRQKRVHRYGQSMEQLKAGGGVAGMDEKYAMFAMSYETVSSLPIHPSTHRSRPELRNRSTNHGEKQASSKAMGGIEVSTSKPMNTLNPKGFEDKKLRSYYYLNGKEDTQRPVGGPAHQYVNRNDSKEKKKNAQQVEKTIAQMGELFSKMASLVSESNEAIARIEGDVEAGYNDTVQANQSIQNLYELTKGNRSMIVKVFALLMFFVLLFLLWT